LCVLRQRKKPPAKMAIRNRIPMERAEDRFLPGLGFGSSAWSFSAISERVGASVILSCMTLSMDNFDLVI
jgi:hypothetical protein